MHSKTGAGQGGSAITAGSVARQCLLSGISEGCSLLVDADGAHLYLGCLATGIAEGQSPLVGVRVKPLK